MNRTAKLFAILALAVPAGAVAAGCGGDESSDEDPQEVLSATFNNSDSSVTSGVIDLTFELSAEGEEGGSLVASVSGPFQGDPEDPEALPALDLTATVEGEGAGQSIDFEGGLTLTEDNAFVEYGGETYEVGTQMFSQFKEGFESAAAEQSAETEGDAAASFQEGCETAIEAQGGDPAACDFDISTWFSDLQNEGTEDVGGAETTHIAGTLNIQEMLGDLVNIGLSVPEAQAQAGGLSPELIEGQLDQFSEAVTEAGFDVYSATEDDSLRKLEFALGIDPSAVAAGLPVPVEDVNLAFGVELSDVGTEQTIEAPADAQPIEGLLEQFGGLGALEELGGLGGVPGGTGIPELDDLESGGSGSGSGGSGSGGGGQAKQAEQIADCLADAATPEAINDCLGA